MKILHLSTPDTWRGGEQQIAYLLEALPSLGAQQALLSPACSPLSERADALAVPHYGFTKTKIPGGRLRILQKTVDRYRPDIIHAHDSKAHSLAVAATSLWGWRIPLVVSRRVDFTPGRAPFSRWKYRHQRVAVYLCVSQAIAAIMRDYLGEKQRIEVVHSGIRMDAPEPVSKDALRKLLEIAPDDTAPIIGNVAALAPHKDYLTFLNAAHHLIFDLRKPAHFVMIGGDGGQQQQLLEYRDRYGLRPWVHHLGFRTDARQLITALDVFLFTSKTEGLGTSVLDAFLAGTPVVATRAGGIPESVIHEQTGLLASVGDAAKLAAHIRRLLLKPEEAHQLAQKAFQHLKNFDYRHTAERTYRIYERILAGRP